MASNTHQYPCLDDSAAVGDWKTVNSYYINNFKEYKPSESSFKNRYILLCRWQTQVEFFLYQLCRIAAPNVVDECHWHCPEAAELSRLSEKITEYFCFHHKKAVQVSGISETEREDFCANIHGIRQVRHCAVHRVPANAITIAKYAKMVQNVLSISRRLGGTKFENAYGDLLDRFLDTLWDIKGHNIPQVSLQLSLEEPRSSTGEYSPRILFTPNEMNTMNIRHMIEQQNVALERRLQNITRMAEDLEVSQALKVARQARITQQTDEAEQRKSERAKRTQQEHNEAEQKKTERAKQTQQVHEEAEQKKAERAERTQQEHNEAEQKKAERAKQTQQELLKAEHLY